MGSIISADYYPEMEKEKGYIKINVKTYEVIEEKLTSYDCMMPMYFHHAKKGLQEYIENKESSKEKIVIWF